MVKYIAGIGTTKLSEVNDERYTKWREHLKELAADKSNCLVTGGAPGADVESIQTWYWAENYNVIIHLPYKDFNRKQLKYFLDFNMKDTSFYVVDKIRNSDAYKITKEHHPAPDKLNDSTINFHARNYMIANCADEIIALPELPFEKEVTYDNLKNLFGGTLQTCRLGLFLNKQIYIY